MTVAGELGQFGYDVQKESKGKVTQMSVWKRYAIVLAVALGILGTSASSFAGDEDINVKVERNGEEVVIDLNFVLDCERKDAWNVLVDYDHMTEFLSNLKFSKILEQHGNKLKVQQKGESSRAGITFSFESIRDVELVPEEKISSHVVSGTIKKLEGLTTLHTIPEGTRVEYHSVSIPNVWLPPLIGTSILESEARKQFGEMRAEILRRKAKAKN